MVFSSRKSRSCHPTQELSVEEHHPVGSVWEGIERKCML